MTSIQIVPRNDTGEHDQTRWCKCNPRLEMVNGVLIVCHHAYDLREVIENANQILNNSHTENRWEIITQD